MTIASGRRSKYAIALQLAGGLAFACLARVSPVGVVGLGGRDLRIQPSLSSERILQWLHQLRRFRYDEPTALGRRITDLAPSLTSRAMILVLSDLHDPDALPALKLLSQKHDCAVFQLRDPAEKGIEGAGFLRAREAETGRDFVTRARKTWVDPEVAAAQLRRSGIDHLVVETDKPFAACVRHFCRSRSLLGRGAR